MQLMVTGATGFIGRHLIPALLSHQHRVFVMGRDPKKINSVFGDHVTALTWEQLEKVLPDDIDAVINLAGENIGDSRWSRAKKIKIKTSRVNATNKISTWALRYQQKKPHIYNASAIGIYGLQQTTSTLPPPFTESTPIAFGKPTDFLSDVGQAWESALKPAVEAGIPVTFMRFAPVLKCGEGMLKKLELPFSVGLGSILGSGEQPFTWIHIDDLIAGIIFLLNHPDVTGPVNLCAPECILQKKFAKVLAAAMGRPLFIKMPNSLIKILFGQMGEELLLKGQNVAPQRLSELGFKFNYPDLNVFSSYLKNQYRRSR